MVDQHHQGQCRLVRKHQLRDQLVQPPLVGFTFLDPVQMPELSRVMQVFQVALQGALADCETCALALLEQLSGADGITLPPGQQGQYPKHSGNDADG